MKALIIGATGATGLDLVDTLLNDAVYSQVVTFVRRATGLVHPKLTEVITDFDHLEKISTLINGEVLFCCLGTTLKVAGSKESQKHIDLEIPLKFVELARANGLPRIVLLSAYGASASSKVFYSRLKGELEQGIGVMGFEQYVIFRPGLLLRKDTDRWGEQISSLLLKLANSIGIAKSFRPLPTKLLAEKLAKSPTVLSAGRHVIELGNIFDF